MIPNFCSRRLNVKHLCLFSNSKKTYSNNGNNSETSFISIKNLKITLSNKMGIETGFNPIPKDRSSLLKYLPKSQEELPKRSMQDSFIAGLIPLSTDKKLQDKYVSILGSVRLGRLLEDMDIFAVLVAYKHIHNPKIPEGTPFPYALVTALVDKIVFTEYIPKPQEDIKISGQVTWVGKSSLEVAVWLEQRTHDIWNRITRAVFVLVARNSTNTNSAIINALEPANEREKTIYLGGTDRKKRREKIQETHLLKVMPNNEEQQIIHDMYLRTTTMEGRQRHLPPGAMWMKDSTLSSIIFSHPEDRNLHNTVFGGFIMRQAVELTWVLAYRFSKYRPALKCISDINFKKPVPVNSLIEMHAHIVYTHLNFIQIIAYVEVYDPSSAKGHTTNTFHFTYEVPQIVKEVIPITYDDAMMYINGKRHFEEIMTVDSKNVRLHVHLSDKLEDGALFE